MNDFDERLAVADRLQAIASRVGFALWQFQTLEDISAQFLVLTTKAQLGMGKDAAAPLLKRHVLGPLVKT